MQDRQLELKFDYGIWSWPMGLTMLRLLLLPVFLYLIVSDAGSDMNRRWALAIFAVMAVTDKLDGYLARKLNQTSKLGAMLDPVADKLLIACAVVVLSIPRIAPEGFRIPVWLVLVIYGKDLIMAFGALALLSLIGKVSINPRPLGKASTFLQLVLVIVTLLSPDLARMDPRTTNYAFNAMIWCTALVTVASGVDYVALGTRLVGTKRRSATVGHRSTQIRN